MHCKMITLIGLCTICHHTKLQVFLLLWELLRFSLLAIFTFAIQYYWLLSTCSLPFFLFTEGGAGQWLCFMLEQWTKKKIVQETNAFLCENCILRKWKKNNKLVHIYLTVLTFKWRGKIQFLNIHKRHQIASSSAHHYCTLGIFCTLLYHVVAVCLW